MTFPCIVPTSQLVSAEIECSTLVTMMRGKKEKNFLASSIVNVLLHLQPACITEVSCNIAKTNYSESIRVQR